MILQLFFFFGPACLSYFCSSLFSFQGYALNITIDVSHLGGKATSKYTSSLKHKTEQTWGKLLFNQLYKQIQWVLVETLDCWVCNTFFFFFT